jgi:subfamily B ATP-binding cassette protein HlyB/CyaB
VTAGILFFGAKLVIESSLSVDELVAVNMLAGRVSAPVLLPSSTPPSRYSKSR